jgi:hypothetical protein
MRAQMAAHGNGGNRAANPPNHYEFCPVPHGERRGCRHWQDCCCSKACHYRKAANGLASNSNPQGYLAGSPQG